MTELNFNERKTLQLSKRYGLPTAELLADLPEAERDRDDREAYSFVRDADPETLNFRVED